MNATNGYGKYCPNPQFERKDYLFLCGQWQFCMADSETANPVFDREIVVPYSYESKASGIGDESVHCCVWYRRTFPVRAHRGKVLLHFEAVDYFASVFVNGSLAGEHRGGYTEFCLDITPYVKEGENVLTVRVLDSLSKSQLRGKQRAKAESYECWYVQTTGIWKPVWLEYAGETCLECFRVHASADGTVRLECELSGEAETFYEIYDGEKCVFSGGIPRGGKKVAGAANILSPKLWSADAPHLYTMKIRVSGEPSDEVYTYFGIREISLREDGVYINGKREYQQMILDQGYWPDTMLTAPDESALERDVELIKRMGFNGVRKHQKVESHIFYYLCDKLGLYVWGEIPSAYIFDAEMRGEFTRDTRAIVAQLSNHPSVICWLLFNETWGVYSIKDSAEQQAFVESVEKMVRKLDDRPVITNDGWSHLDSDILSLHEYEQNPETFRKEYAVKDYVVTDKKINTNFYGKAFADGYRYRGQPVMISEYGGVAIDGAGGWGYGAGAADTAAFAERVRSIADTVKSIPYVCGCCYTQLTDVQQEVNGLLTADRVPKLPTDVIREIFSPESGQKRAERMRKTG